MGTPEVVGLSGALFGRERESAVIDRLLQASAQGESSSVVLRGEAGIGKTALLEHAAEQSGDRTVLRIAGVEAESDLAFAGLDGLLRPIMDGIDELPQAQADALSAALGLAPSRGSDRLLVSAAVLSLLAAAADDRPLLCLIDAVQFLDVASTEALLFSARRLGAEPVAMIFGVREGSGRDVAAPGLRELVLEGLGLEAAARLLEASAPSASEPVREWLLAQAAGNPLALLELPVGLSAEQLDGRAALPAIPPLTAGLRTAFVQRIDRLPEGTRRALLIAALDDREEVATVMRALGEADLPENALDAAERDGLLRATDLKVEFRHPLVRSALLEASTHSQRRAGHAALAAALADDKDADRRAWHQALASLTADADVADALEISAHKYLGRGGHASAATAFARAAELSKDEGLRTDRLGAAADAAWAAGQPERARDLIGRALPLATGELRAELLYLQGVIEARTGDLRGAIAVLIEAAETSDSPSFQLDALSEAAEGAVFAGESGQGVAIGARAGAIEPQDELDR